MLPLAEVWYRRLLLVSLLLGVAGAGIALAFSGSTLAGIDLLFGDPTAEYWSGQWWWVPLVSGGALLVAVLRTAWSVPEKVPGGVADVKKGWVEPSGAFQVVLISAISLVVGASLGPSLGVIVGGGGLGAWLASRDPSQDADTRKDFSLTGMSGSLGAVFSAPLFAAALAGELSPTPKKYYVASFIPQFIAAVVGYAIFFGITGTLLWGSYELGGYEFEAIHLLYGVVLGLASILTVVAFIAVGKVVGRLAGLIGNAYAKAVVGGALVGLIAFAIPLAATGGSAQLAYETEHVGSLGVGLLLAVLLGKMVAVALSHEVGFLGGMVFPLLFLGGTAGILVHALFPSIPVALAVGAMIAAVPGAIVDAPLSFTLFGLLAVGVGFGSVPPIGLAVVTAHLGFSAVKLLVTTEDQA